MGALLALGIVGAIYFIARDRRMREAGQRPALPPAGGGASPGQPPIGPTVPGPVVPTPPGAPPPPGAFPSPCLDANPDLAAQFQDYMTDVSIPPASLSMAANLLDQLGCRGEATLLRNEAARRSSAGGGLPGGLPLPFPGGGSTPPFFPFPTQTSGQFPAPPSSVADIGAWMERLRNAA